MRMHHTLVLQDEVQTVAYQDIQIPGIAVQGMLSYMTAYQVYILPIHIHSWWLCLLLWCSGMLLGQDGSQDPGEAEVLHRSTVRRIAHP